ncbi:hypothetical protein TNCV_2206451 [Trichonephila clavipes]|uniref:Uncharacterized protein n=1 Tax=Trichonephila clavipes TaxID=2585209 RepID=A0A8X6VF74_TRICX|nr:hypothetical protein TNCV_2206451 [Trichonephila clavipes]
MKIQGRKIIQERRAAKRIRAVGGPWGNLKHLAYDAPVATMVDLMARIVVTSAVIASTEDFYENCRQSIVRQCW